MTCLCIMYSFLTFSCHISYAFSTAHNQGSYCTNGYSLLIVNKNKDIFPRKRHSSLMISHEKRKRNLYRYYYSLVPTTWSTSLFSSSSKSTHYEHIPALQENSMDHNHIMEEIPRDMNQALRRFFFHRDKGPLIMVFCILTACLYRLHLHWNPPMLHTSYSYYSSSLSSITVMDGLVFILAMVFWWIQEYFIHQKLLHSNFDWIGKTIHEQHHTQSYFHISIDPPTLMVPWLLVIYFILQLWLPYPLSLSAMIGYALAGMGYEWIHYLVHTKVPLKHNGYLETIRNLHIRHHLVSHENYFSFSMPFIDDIMQTNPSTRWIVEKGKMTNKRRNK